MSEKSYPRKIHFIGVCGVSMSALAKLALIRGCAVSGSDAVFSDEILALCDAGVNAYAGHNPDIACSADLVVYTGAVNDSDPELRAARERLIPTVERQHYLAEVARGYQRVVAVAGTHGKTTTTAMLASVLLEAGLAFTAHIGGRLPEYGNLVYKGDDLFLTEACEFRRSFLALKPDYAVITNIELDHPDTYKSLAEVYGAFKEFAASAKRGTVTDDVVKGYLAENGVTAVSAGLTGDYRATQLLMGKNGCYGFQINKSGNPYAQVTLSIVGSHNVNNAIEAFALADKLGIDPRAIERGLNNFKGAKRRFEAVPREGAALYVDYAHHPSELRAAIRAALTLKPARLLCVFQPHTYSRTALLYDDFLTAFDGANELFIFKTYSARETEGDGMSGYDLFSGLKAQGAAVSYYENTVALAAAVLAAERAGDIILILGAGDVDSLAELLK